MGEGGGGDYWVGGKKRGGGFTIWGSDEDGRGMLKRC